MEDKTGGENVLTCRCSALRLIVVSSKPDVRNAIDSPQSRVAVAAPNSPQCGRRPTFAKAPPHRGAFVVDCTDARRGPPARPRFGTLESCSPFCRETRECRHPSPTAARSRPAGPLWGRSGVSESSPRSCVPRSACLPRPRPTRALPTSFSHPTARCGAIAAQAPSAFPACGSSRRPRESSRSASSTRVAGTSTRPRPAPMCDSARACACTSHCRRSRGPARQCRCGFRACIASPWRERRRRGDDRYAHRRARRAPHRTVHGRDRQRQDHSARRVAQRSRPDPIAS